MTRTTYERVAEALSYALDVSASVCTLDASLDVINDDPLDRSFVGHYLENEFGIRVTDDDIESMVTVRSIVEYVDRRLACQAKVRSSAWRAFLARHFDYWAP